MVRSKFLQDNHFVDNEYFKLSYYLKYFKAAFRAIDAFMTSKYVSIFYAFKAISYFFKSLILDV